MDEDDGSAPVDVELRAAEIAFDVEVTVQTIAGGSATGNMTCDV